MHQARWWLTLAARAGAFGPRSLLHLPHGGHVMGFKPTDTLPSIASTSVYIERNGIRYAVFHRSLAGSTSWTHDYTQKQSDNCPVCKGRPMSGAAMHREYGRAVRD